MFHNRDHLTVDVLNAIHLFFKNSKQQWKIFPGNHDMFFKTSWKITSIKPLEKYAEIFTDISSFKIDNRNFIILPFIHHESQYMQALSDLESKHPKESVLLTHIGVNNAVNNSCFLIKFWSMVNLSKVKFDVVFSGHFHNYQNIDKKIYYPGSPIPFRFDEGMVDHGFIVFDTDTAQTEFISLKETRDDYPMDFVTVTDDLLEKNPQKYNNNKIRVVLSREYSKSELDGIRNAVTNYGAKSVSWMKLQSKEEEIKIDKIDETKSPFCQWLEHQKNDNYNAELLMKLYNSVSEEAEDLYNKSNENNEE